MAGGVLSLMTLKHNDYLPTRPVANIEKLFFCTYALLDFVWLFFILFILCFSLYRGYFLNYD